MILALKLVFSALGTRTQRDRFKVFFCFLLNIFICSIHRNYINKIKSIVVQNKTINVQNECIDKVVFSIKNIQRK